METEVVPGGPAALAERAAVWLADEIWAAVTARRVAHVAVSGGSTPTVMFEVLAGLPVPWDRVHVWQVDERAASESVTSMTGSPGGHDAVCPSGPTPRWTTSKTPSHSVRMAAA